MKRFFLILLAFAHALKETRNSYFFVTPNNQVLLECALRFFKYL